MTQVPVVPEYPPPRHVLRDLGLSVEHRPDRTSRAWLAVEPQLTTPSGVPRAGIIATLVDVLGGGLAGLTARPSWIATADLTLHLLGRPLDGGLEARGRVLRAGRTTVVIDVALTSESGARAGMATMSFAVLPRREGNPVLDQVDTVQRMVMDGGVPFDGPALERIGIRTVDAGDGVVELPYHDYVRNSLGAVQGGMMASVAEVAAQEALGAACGAEVDVVDLQVTYLALAKVGPVRSRTRVLAATPEHGVAHVELFDSGADDRLTTLVRAVAVRRP